MAHSGIIIALKAHAKVVSSDVPPSALTLDLVTESDRGAVILAATIIDDTIASKLKAHMPNLNNEEMKRILFMKA